MIEANQFQDRANLEHIREHLYKGTEYGRVAVMIGAGFSRNAEKFSPQIPDFPLAWDLGKIIYSKLHPEYDLARSKGDIDFGQNFDKYASDYSQRFGKGELYSLLIKSIPDEKYIPGEIHKLLLQLPWSDIFTTNYDTLLERASKKIIHRKYDIIKTVTQIPLKSKPRIVKLHGDIPSHSFIITKDDYTGYKEKYGAFQNLVQESIIENVFCLIGFRGNDKNFVTWKDWVRKNLGDYSSPIFLCGILDLDENDRLELNHDHIKIIDLGPLFPREKFIDANARHKIAIEWFLKSLALGEPNDKLNWPDLSRKEVAPIKNPLAPPLCPLPDLASGNLKYISLIFESKTVKQDIEHNSEIWRLERSSYPGWIIAPKKNRNDVWEQTKDSLNPILKNFTYFEFPHNLSLLSELVWRLDICLSPLFKNVADCIEVEIKKINPFPDLISIDGSEINPHKEQFQKNNWDTISHQWINLVYSLVRHHRESNDQERYNFWMENLEKLNALNSNWKNKWYYEKCLFALFQLNQEELRKHLSAWSIDNDYPEYQVKKAGLLAELGDLEKSKLIAEQALQTVRHHLHSNREDYYLLSLEGWCLMLLNSLKRSQSFGGSWDREFGNRWDQLAKYNCDPRIELEKFKASISIPKPQNQQVFERKRGFDLGVITQSFHFSRDPDIVKVLPAFAFLKMVENVGHPLVCGRIRFSEEISFAADWIERYNPYWAMSVISRSKNEELIDNKFQRLAISRIDQSTFDNYYNLAIDSLRQSIIDYSRKGHDEDFDSTFSYRQIKTQIELLSRLSIRLSDDRLNDLLEIAIALYKIQGKTPVYDFYDGIENLFKRVSQSISHKLLLERLETLINLPIPSSNYFVVPNVEKFPEPFAFLYFPLDFEIPADFERGSWALQISNLIHISEIGTPDERKRALLRLIRLFKIKGLTPSEIEGLKHSLWLNVDPVSHLPVETGYYNFVLLGLPELKPGDAQEKYRKWLISQPVPTPFTRAILPNGKPQTTKHVGGAGLAAFIHEWLYSSKRLYFRGDIENENLIEWSETEILILYNQISKIWNEQKTWFSDYKGKEWYFYSELVDQFEELLMILEQIVLFNLDKITSYETADQILNTISEFSENDIHTNSALPFILIISPGESGRVVKQLRQGLFSTDSKVSKTSVIGFYNYAILAYNKKVAPMDEVLIRDFVYSVILRKEPGLSYGLDITNQIIKGYPELFAESQIEDLLFSLSKIILRPNQSEMVQQNEEIQISDAEYEAVMRHASELGKSFKQFLISKNKPIPDFLN